MSHTWKKLLSMLLVIVMVFQLLPTAAFAEDGDIVIVETQDPEEIQLIEDYGDEEDENEIVIQDLTVSFEASERRGETEKHFRLSDGSFAAASYNQPVHYQDVTGDWQEIDNTLEARDGSYLARAGMVEKEFSLFPESDYLFRYSFDGYTLLFTAVEPIGDEKGEEDVELPVEIEEPADESEEPEDPAEESETEPGEEPEPEDPDPGEETDPGEDTEPGDEDPEIIVGNSAPADGGEDITDPSEEEDEEPEIIIVETEPEDELVEEEPEEPTEVKAPEEAVLLDPETDEDLAKAGYRRITGEKLALNVENAKSDIDVFGLTLEQAADLTRLTSTLCYEDILPGVSYVYRNIGYNVKESILIAEPQEEYCFSFAVKTNGLTIREEEDGSLTFVNAAGEPVFVIPAPFLFDAAGEYSDAAAYRISEYEGGAILTIEADKDWLNDPARVFPVTLDPTITTFYHSTSNGMSATYVREGKPNQTYTNYMTLKIGYDTPSDTQEMQIYLGFDALPQLPNNAVVSKATINMTQLSWNAGSLSTVDIGAYQVSQSKPAEYNSYSSWIGSRTWNNKPQVDSSLVDFVSCTSSMTNYHAHWNITRCVRSWYNNGETRAICLKLRDRENYGSSQTAVLSFLGYGGTNLQDYSPYLTVTYRNTVGVESYYSYQSSSIDRAGAAYIADYTGALTLVHGDLSAASTVTPVTVSHVYNSAYAGGEISEFAPGAAYANMYVGKGWKLDFQQSISSAGSNYLQYMDADGTIHYFQYAFGQTYYDEDGLGLTLYPMDNNGTYIMTDRKGNGMHFENGLLKYIVDNSGNKIKYIRNNLNQVTSVVRQNNGQSEEEIATLTYENCFLKEIHDSRGYTKFDYTGTYLTSITHPDGTIVEYVYSNGLLTQATDGESGYRVNYSYDVDSLRIDNYTEKARSENNSTIFVSGASVSVRGNDGLTCYRYCGKDRTLNNNDDLIASYVFDYAGRTITNYTTNADRTVIYGASGGQYSVNSGTSGSNNRLQIGSSVGMRPVGTTLGYTFSTQNLLTDSRLIHQNGYSLSGDPSSTSRITQTILANGPSGNISSSPEQTYIFSGWAKATSIPLLDGTSRRFELRATITYTDTTEEVQKVSYCADSTEWQYLVLPIVPKEEDKTVYSLKVGFYYDHNANSALFKLGCLTKEPAASYKWDNDGNLISVSTPESATPQYSYSGADLITMVTRGSGTVNYTYYDNTHRVKYVTNDGVRMRLNYDSAGNTTESILSSLTDSTLKMTSSALYSEDYNVNLLTSQMDTRGSKTEYEYDTDISMLTGQPTMVTDAKNNSVTTSLDSANGRVTGSAMTGVSLAYDYIDGQLSEMTRTVGNAEQTYYLSHDAFGNLTQVAVGSRTLAEYDYLQHNGVLSRLKYGNGASYVAYSYDDLERTTGMSYYNSGTSGSGGTIDSSVEYAYFGEGTLKSAIFTTYDYTDPDVVSTHIRNASYTYDNLSRLTGTTETYDNVTVQTYSASYDTADRVSQIQYSVAPAWNGTFSAVRRYRYNYSSADGSLTQMNFPTGAINTTYLTYNYDGLRRLSSRTTTLSSSLIQTRSYTYLPGTGSNTSALVSGLAIVNGSNTPLANYAYSYDVLGNITSISGSTNAIYTYDAQGQLLSETRGGHTYYYEYDAGGNIKNIRLDDENSTPITTYIYSDANGWCDLLTAYNSINIYYDSVGNPTNWPEFSSLSWKNGRQLVQSVKGTQTINYAYDADGLRLKKTVDGVDHLYTWQGGRLVAEYWDGHALEFFYDESGSPLAMAYFSDFHDNPSDNNPNVQTRYYYVTNLQGDVIGLTDDTGALVATYEYNAWGEPLNTPTGIGAINPLRYRGYYYDTESGFYYLQSRYYDPNICRFINADGLASTGQGFVGCNMFAYCLNNPVSGADYWGFWGIIGFSRIEEIWDLIFHANEESEGDGYIDPNKPPNPESGYVPPKGNPNPGKVKNPNGPGRGFPSDDGGVWVPDNKQHGGPGWVEQFPDGTHQHRYPDGKVRSHINAGDVLRGGILVVASGVAIVVLTADDATGIGVIDDAALPPLIITFEKGVEMLASIG